MYKAAAKFSHALANRGHGRISDPRGWNSHTRSLTRPKQAGGAENKKERMPRIPPHCVYLVIFSGKKAPFEKFLKVGISKLDLAARFQADLEHYEIELCAKSSITGKDAFLLEQAIHAAFAADRTRPKIRLASGNTECYRFDDKLRKKLAAIIVC